MEYGGEDNLEQVMLAKNYNRFLVKSVASMIQKKDDVIIDFGSGTAYMTEAIEKEIGKQIISIEPAQNLYKYYKNRQHFDSLDDLSDGSVDFIYSLNVLEHIEDDEAIVAKFYQKLKPQGILFLYVPACEVLHSSMDEKVGHYRRYTKTKILKILSNDRWCVKNIKYADFLGFFATFAYKLIGSDKGDISSVAICFYDKFLTKLSFFLDKITFGKLLGKNILVVAEKKIENDE